MENIRSAATKNKLKNTFFELCKDSHYVNISVINLCKAAQIGRSTFYIYYENIEQFYRETAAEVLNELEPVMSGGFDRSLYPYMPAWNVSRPYYYNELNDILIYIQHNQDRIMPFIYPQRDPFFMRQFKDIYMQKLYAEREKSAGSPVQNSYISVFIFFAMSESIFYWLLKKDISKDELLETCVYIKDAMELFGDTLK